MRVLLVDDEPITKVGVRKLMQNGTPGFELTGTASNGIEALSFVQTHPVDIVITDLKMPQMDGLQLIHQLKSNGFSGAILVLSNYSDFELVREALLAGAVDYLLKVNITTDLLKAQLEKAADHLAKIRRSAAEHSQVLAENESLVRTNQLRDYFSAPLEYSAPPQEGAAQVLQLMNIFVFPHSANSKKKLPLDGLTELLHTIFEPCQTTVLVMQPNELICLVYGGSGAQLPFRIEEKANLVVRQLAMYLDLNAVVFLPKLAGDLALARRAYAQCQAAHDLLFYGCQWGIVFADTVNFSPLPDAFQSQAVAHKMHQLYKDAAALSTYLDTLLAQCATQRTAPDEVRHFFFLVLEKLCLTANPSKSASRHPRLDSMILQSATAAQLLQHLCKLLPDLLEHALPAFAAGYRKEVKEVLLHISFHYSEKLTLEGIANAVSLNPSYLCRLFKKETGVSLFHYIGQFRMERAARLIEQGNTYIREVAAMVGMDDQFYFARLFKKHYSMSPTEYQALHLQG